MADLNFPLNPQINDTYTLNNRTFRYDGTRWRYVNLSIITLTSGSAITSLNNISSNAQDFSVGTSGSLFNISSTGSTHTFNIPIAGSGSTGLISTGTQTLAGLKTFSSDLSVTSSTASTNTTTGALVVSGGVGIGGSVNVGGRVGIGTNLLDSTLNIRTSTAATPGIVIQGSTSQSASLFRVNSSVGGSFFEITNSGIVNIKTSTAGDFNSVPLQRWYSDDNSIVGVFQKSGSLYTGYGLGYVDGAGSQTLVHFWVPNSSYYITNWSKRMANGTQIMFSSSAGGDVRIYGDTNGSLTFQSYGTYTNNTMVKLMDPNYTTNQALLGVISGGYTRSQLFSYGNLALNMTIAGSAGTDWDTTNLFRANVDTKTKYLGNLAVLAVDDTNRFVVGPYGNTTVSLGGTTTSTGLLVKAAASQSGNIIETQASTGVTNFYISPTGGASFSDNIEIKSAKELRLNNSGNTFYTGLKAGANASNTTYTLPIAFPGTGTSVLQSDTSGTLSWVAMTASGSGLTNLNSLTAGIQYFSVGTSGNFFNISSSGSTHTFNIPIAGSGSTGLVTNSTQTIAGAKTFSSDLSVTSSTASTSTTSGSLIVSGGVGIGGSLYVTSATGISGVTINAGVVTGSLTGTATTATNVNVVAASSNTFHRVLFTPASGSASGAAVSTESSFVYNPSTDILTISGLAVTSQTSSTNTSSGALIVSGGVGVGGTIFAGGLNIQDIFTLGSQIFYPQNTRGFSVNENYNPVGSGASHTGYHFASGVGRSSIYFDLAISNQYTVMFGTYGSSTGNTFVIGSETANSDFEFRSTVGIQPVRLDLGTLLMRINRNGNVLIPASTNSTTTSTGALTVTGGVAIGQSVSVGGRLQLFNGANYTAFVSSASGNTVYTLPATSPATGSSVLQSTSAGVMSWVPMTSGSSTPAGTSDGVVQFKSSSSLGGTLSLFFDPLLLGLRVSGFPGGETPTSTSAALKLESTVGSFNGSVNGTYYAANAPTGFAGDLMNLQINSVSKFRIDNTGAIIQNIGTNATSTTSGSVQVRGGLGITGALFTGESINSTATTNSTNTTSGSLIVSGGAGIAGTINVGGTAKIFSSTASTNTWTGALLVGGGVGISGQLTFTQASLGFTGITTNPSMSFIGATSSSPITLTVLTDNSLNWEGSQGSVFSIDSNLSTGEIFSVSDISGLPIISASAGQTVNINEFGGFTQIGNGSLNSSSTTTGSLRIVGGLGVTGNSYVGGSIVLSNNIYSGGNTFTKSGQAPGDIIFDNGGNDTAGLLYYYKNNTNFGIDVFATGTGSTRFRIVRDLNESGGSELWSIDRNGVVARTGWDVGEVIATRVYNNTDLNMQATNTIGITSYVTIAEITYTPKSSSSFLWIEFDAHYDFNGGSAADDFFSRITVGGSTIMEKNQIFIFASGGGTRSGVIFPISGRYTNTSTSGIAITVQARRGTADDNLRVYGSSTSGYMRIQEIGR